MVKKSSVNASSSGGTSNDAYKGVGSDGATTEQFGGVKQKKKRGSRELFYQIFGSSFKRTVARRKRNTRKHARSPEDHERCQIGGREVLW